MKILIVLDSLGTGGAQRLKSQLAQGLVERGHEVEIFIYVSEDQFFASDFKDAGIKIHVAYRQSSGFSFQVLKQLRALLKVGYDAVISSLHAPSIYSALAILGIKECKLIVCEESSSNAPLSFFRKYIFYFATLMADSIVPNSFNESKLMKKLPGRTKKIHPIWNGYDLSSIPFYSNKINENHGISKLLVVGRIAYPKNGINLLKGLSLFLSQNEWLPEVFWVGRRDTDKRSLKMQEDMDSYLLNNPKIAEKWNWLGVVEDVREYYQSCDALMHVSSYEGLPNAICEAMLSGCFVVASDVCDHPLMLGKEERGLLCKPDSPESICDAIERLDSMQVDRRNEIIRKARHFAEGAFNRDSMVQKYELLLSKD